MNDDITVREFELATAIVNELYGYFSHIYPNNQAREGKYIDGYIAAIEVVNETLEGRGFDITPPNQFYSEE